MPKRGERNTCTTFSKVLGQHTTKKELHLALGSLIDQSQDRVWCSAWRQYSKKLRLNSSSDIIALKLIQYN